MFRFAHSEFFLAFLLIPLISALFVLFLIRRKKAMEKYGELRLLGILAPDQSFAKPILKFVLLAAAQGVVASVSEIREGREKDKEQKLLHHCALCMGGGADRAMGAADDSRPFP